MIKIRFGKPAPSANIKAHIASEPRKDNYIQRRALKVSKNRIVSDNKKNVPA